MRPISMLMSSPLRTLRRLALALALVATPLAAISLAPEPAFAADLKVGVVDFGRAIKATEGSGGALENLESEANKATRALKKLEDEILAMEQEIKENGQVYSEDKMKELFVSYRKKVSEYRESVVRAQMEFDEKRARVLGEIQRSMQEISVEIAQENKLDLMLERNEGAVLYFNNTFDFTDELIKRYKAKGSSASKN